ncbi:MAG: alcohol dehydrogenase catalytic domain-containing protein [Dehalococcoidia bacterium]
MHAVYFDDGKVALREIEEPVDEGRRVHVRSIGICGSDLHMLEMKFPTAYVAGHEIAGVLDDGTPVVVEPVVPCGECEFCKVGKYNLCPDAMILGIARNGGMADEVIVPERCLVHLPSNVHVMDACLAEPLAVAVHGIHLAGVKGNQRVAVIGGGTIGLCAVAVASANGAEVGLSALYDHQTAIGRRFGAGNIEGQYGLVVDCAGTDQAINQAIRICQPGGTVLILGTYWESMATPQLLAMMKEITIVNSYMYAESNAGRDFDIAAALLSRNPGMAGSLITHRFPLSEVEQAFSTARDRKWGAIKVVLEP